jgi:CMP-N,N'-diacetyllegionaminic acid synthase
MGNAFALIPARGGSKGIPRKNVKEIAGKPLIAWTIEAAMGCPSFERVIVSSDDDEILAIAARYGAEPMQRPAELATDTIGAKPVLAHALEEYQKTYGALPRFVSYLQPTSPLRTAEHLIGAFTLLEKDPTADAVISVSEIDNGYLKASIANAEGYLEYAAKREFANMNRQMLPKLYMPNGAIYIMETAKCLPEPRFDGERTLPYVMTAEESIDLDTPEDLPSVEAALRAR